MNFKDILLRAQDRDTGAIVTIVRYISRFL